MNDPYLIPPRLWFGVLCYGVGTDQVGQITLQGVFNQLALLTPPAETGVPRNGFLNAVLAVGLTEGLGHFDVDIDLRNIDDRVLWQRAAGQWSFEMGPGGNNAAILVEQVVHWFTEPGRYYFRVFLTQVQVEHQILFEVAERIGPAVTQDASPESPR